MIRRSWVPHNFRVYCAAAVLCFALTNGFAQGQNEMRRTAAQLEQLVAPIALYPDALLSQILMASTYPLEVVTAARWVKANPGVTGKPLEDAMQKEAWDPSVKALTAAPQALQMMNDKLDWTRDLGDAFLAQQGDVLDAVQRLRQRADNAGNLKTTEQLKVVKTAASPAVEPDAQMAPTAGTAQPAVDAMTIYALESVNPDEYYVPVYDPAVVYGAWPYPEYAPFYWYPPGWVGGGVLAFAAGVAVGAAIWGGIDWWKRRVDINVNRYNNFNRTNIANGNWTHNPAHRGAVPYRDRSVTQQFGKPAQAAAREAYRGTANAGRQELVRQRAGKGRQQGAAAKVGAAAATGAAGALAGKGAGNRAGKVGQKGASAKIGAATATGTAGALAGKGARQRADTGRADGQRDRRVTRPQAALRNASAPRHHAPRQHISAPRRHVSAPPVHRHISRGAGGARAMARGGRGGRRSDIRLKHDIMLLGRLQSGLGLYRFVYNGEDTTYVGVLAQEVRMVEPESVVRGRDGYLRVRYEKLGLQFQTYEQWVRSGARIQ
jgi:hypothetical protein